MWDSCSRFVFFFFQAEDGIRDATVTGVQTCALPILGRANLAPADIRKAGPAYDLPIAVGLLLASEQLSGYVERALFVGELGLDGALRHTDGILPKIGRASCRERVWISVGAVAVKETR